MKKPRDILCPKCQTKVGRYDGRGTIDIICRCRRCKKQVIYRVKIGEIEIKDIPPRQTSSGMIF